MAQSLKPLPGFTRYAADYDTLQKYWDSFEKNHLIPWIREAKGKRVLDAGAGTGRISLRLLEAGAAEVVALDMTPAMLEKLRQKSDKIKTVEGNVEAMPFADGSFDMVFSCLTLVHLKKIGTFLDECYRVLKDDGVLVLTNVHYRKPMILKDKEGPYIIECFNHFPRHVREAAEALAYGVVDEIMVYEGDKIWITQILILKK